MSDREWRAYPIKELFTTFTAGKSKGLNHLTKARDGGIGYIGATNRNNGILCFVERDQRSEKLIQPGNCIGFIKNGDGAAGYAIYKAEPFISTSDVIFGYSDWLNRATGLFFVAAQDLIKAKYSHGYKRNMVHLMSDRVMLPSDSSGGPDFDFMEQYGLYMMAKKYIQYQNYIEKRLPADSP